MRKRASLIAVAAGGLLISWNVVFADGLATDGAFPIRQYEGHSQKMPARNCNYRKRSFDTVGFDGDNEFDETTGCSVHTGIALMAARKKDLFKGRGTRYSDGERAANIVVDYRAWKYRPLAPHGQKER